MARHIGTHDIVTTLVQTITWHWWQVTSWWCGNAMLFSLLLCLISLMVDFGTTSSPPSKGSWINIETFWVIVQCIQSVLVQDLSMCSWWFLFVHPLYKCFFLLLLDIFFENFLFTLRWKPYQWRSLTIRQNQYWNYLFYLYLSHGRSCLW